MTTLREGLPPLPLRMQHLPIDHRGYVVPWFVAKPPQGQPWDFRIADGEKNVLARRYGRCWVCGEKTGQRKTFVIGPMCAVNRITAEPGCHRDCALFSVQACPFLSLPQAKRNEHGLEGTSEPAGVMIKRNPGVSCLWSTEFFTLMEVETGTLYRLGAPAAVEWWKEKRHATREEILASIDSGMPLLRASARSESAEAEAALERAYTEMIPLLPEAA